MIIAQSNNGTRISSFGLFDRYVGKAEFEDFLYQGKSQTQSKSATDKVFTQNSQTYIMEQIACATSNIKDINGNKIDFNSLDMKQQAFLVCWLAEPLRASSVYGTKAQISEVRINATSQDFYLQFNIHTIDGQIFSAGNKATFKSDEFGVGDDLSFVKAGNLSTSERMIFLDKLKDFEPNDTEDFEGMIYIGSCWFESKDSGLELSSVPKYEFVNIQLDLDKALEVVKNMPEDEPLKAKTQGLLDMFWAKFKAEIEFSMYQAKQKQKNEDFLSSLKEANSKNTTLLQELLNSADNEANSLQGVKA